jgi:protein gp37
MNKTNIEWCDYTWNPVVGCKNGCEYCYAKKMNDRFHFIANWNDPIVWNLYSPKMPQKPSKIFVGSMCDLFGDWVSDEIINEVIDKTREFSEHIFMFLTKNPKRYYEFSFPENCWLGMTATDKNLDEILGTGLMKRKKIDTGNKIFISIEPILGSFRFFPLRHFDLIIIGAMTGNRNNVIPKKEWFDKIEHPNIFYKKNILKYFPELR